MDEIIAGRAEFGVWAPQRIRVVAPDPEWPRSYAILRERVLGALGDRALAIEHIGSTSVPGLWAKPMIDIDLTVADSADEEAWLPDLKASDFLLRLREPEWEEHRLFGSTAPAGRLHIFSAGAREPQRHVMFRNWLRTHAEDRDEYAAVKREIAAQGFTDGMLYNNAKAWFVYDLYEKIFAHDPAHPHDPHPRSLD